MEANHGGTKAHSIDPFGGKVAYYINISGTVFFFFEGNSDEALRFTVVVIY